MQERELDLKRNVRYGRDAAGQVSSQTSSAGTQNYTYTAREQLASDTSGSTASSFAYDAANNPVTVGTSAQTFDAAGQLKTAGATTFAFDAEGDRTAETPGSGTAASYAYNQAGQLTSVTGPDGSGSYTYDGDGLRTSKTVSGTTTTFVWDDAATPDLLSDGTTSYLYGPDGLPIEQTSSSSSDWFVHDQVGSTVLLLSGTGNVAGGYAYTPYGLASHSGTDTTPLQYTGQYTDSESGLVYLRARYYDPVTAQFLTVDPLIDVTHTPYTYVDDSPLDTADPSGACPLVGGGYRPGNQNPANLSPEEQAAIDAKAAGEPYDQKAYKSAMKKINQGQKYSGGRNVQKRKGNTKNNFSSNVEKAFLIGVAAVAAAAVVVVVVASLPVDVVIGAIAGIGAGLSWAFSW